MEEKQAKQACYRRADEADIWCEEAEDSFIDSLTGLSPQKLPSITAIQRGMYIMQSLNILSPSKFHDTAGCRAGPNHAKGVSQDIKEGWGQMIPKVITVAE